MVTSAVTLGRLPLSMLQSLRGYWLSQNDALGDIPSLVVFVASLKAQLRRLYVHLVLYWK